MSETETLAERAMNLLDAHLPRRDPRYAAAHEYLVAYLSTDAATRRLCMRALRNESPDPEPSKATAAPAAQSEPASGDVSTKGPATAASDSGETGTDRGATPAASPVAPSSTPRLTCGGKVCEVKGGVEIHRADASCSKFTVTRKATWR